VRLPLALLATVLVVTTPVGRAEDAPDARAQALDRQREALQLLRQGAEASAKGDAPAFSHALKEAAARLEALLAIAPSLRKSDQEALTRTAAGLKTRAEGSPQGFSPDADLAVIDGVGYRLRG
jgi:hypothetical protein